jgi:hypothetical protein
MLEDERSHDGNDIGPPDLSAPTPSHATERSTLDSRLSTLDSTKD